MTDTPSKTKVSSKIVYQNPWITIHEDQTISQDGNTGIYGYMESRDSCMVVVADDQERLYLVRGFRYPSQSFGWELPGGGGDNEDLLEASKRELEEETGIIAQSWQKLGEAYVCNGLMTEKMAICLAREVSFTGQREQSDEMFSDMRFFTLDEIDDLIQDGEINDCQTLAGLHLLSTMAKGQSMSFDPNDYNELTVTESPIPGLFVVKLPVHGDNRGWFKENYQKEKMEALGLPSFTIVQNNISFNDKAGATRGLHAEPWNKFISTANGRVFGAWCDLRQGDSFGRVFIHEINPGTAIFVPEGVANGYQALDDNIAYTYLVDAHWSPDATYTFVNLFDPALGIDWPISQDQAIISEKDAAHPLLANVIPMEV